MKSLLTLCILLLICLAWGLFAGAPLPADDWRDSDGILWSLRAPRLVTGLLCGGVLSLSGMALQGSLRNELASPFTLGLSSGAAFFAGLGLVAGLSGLMLPPLAFCGALAAGALTLGAAGRRGDCVRLVLAGAAAGFLFGAGIALVQSLAGPEKAGRLSLMMIGRLDCLGWSVPGLLALLLAFCGLSLWRRRHSLDQLLCGDELAGSRGVDVVAERRGCLVIAALLAGTATALCGPIGFVCIAGPHLARHLAGPSHRVQIPAAILCGGLFLSLCDSFGRSLSPDCEIPAGAISALAGCPFFLFLLRRSSFRNN
ncbi:MAG: hypothetical protein RL095_1324 [Verrucomicrobiota bacterium]|jgi:iron complex transport system permease protein